MTVSRNTAAVGILVCAALLASAACNQAPRQSAIRPPAPAPAPLDAQTLQHLPIRPPAPGFLTVTPQPAVDVLVAQIQAQLDRGQQLFNAGNTDAAREEWTRAGNRLLASGFSVERDPRLRALFDKLAEAMGAFETKEAPVEQAAEQQENQEEGEDVEPAPIEEIASLSLPASDPRLARAAEQELITIPHDVPLTVNDSVLAYLSVFETRRGRAIVETGLRRAGLYQDIIRQTFKEEGVPQDLMYLAQAESAFQPQAVSRAGARGIWQFMSYTGQEYGLQRTAWEDDRNDPVKSTQAAARYMRDLYSVLGDWYLVMAAYNTGPLNVARAVERTGYADFWELQKRNVLAGETRNYVPIILAMTLIAKDPARYGITVSPELPLKTDVVRPEHAISLQLAADATDSTVETLRLLNPSLLRSATPPVGTDGLAFPLHIRAGTAERFQTAVAAVPPEKWLSWREHRFEQGETLASIAQRYHVTLASISSANHLEADDPPAAGALLVIPTAPPPSSRIIHYRVRRGDTLDDIASRFGVSVASLRKWNSLRGTHAPVGARLKIITSGSY
jgi:membrane-bound lytic murein transglycosylase D